MVAAYPFPAENRNRGERKFIMTNGMILAGKAILVTGATRGIGRALVDVVLMPAAKQITGV
jgi:FlaA1/EpsC-like NDP-sugar epimerase